MITAAETGDASARPITPAQDAAINMILLRRPILIIFPTFKWDPPFGHPSLGHALTEKAAFIGPNKKLQVKYRNLGYHWRIFVQPRSPQTGEIEEFPHYEQIMAGYFNGLTRRSSQPRRQQKKKPRMKMRGLSILLHETRRLTVSIRVSYTPSNSRNSNICNTFRCAP